jgi:hypothetical protein
MKKSRNQIDIIKGWHICIDALYHNTYECLKRKPTEFSVNIFELDNNINTDVIMMLFFLLKNRDPSTKLNVFVHASIFNSTLLLIAEADVLIARPYTWAYLESPVRISRHAFEDEPDDLPSSRFNAPKIPSGFATNHLSVCEILNEYLPVEEIADRRVFLSDIKEYLISKQDFESITSDATSKNL